MYRKNQGFTLIELITVIAILGALAVIALPRFINLQDEADRAALDGVAGALAADAAINLAAALAGDTASVTVTDCPNLSIQQGISAPYSVPSQTPAAANQGDTFTCEVLNTNAGITTTFNAYAVPTPP